jgi:holliday junction DNA helicase RuvA
MIAYLKGKIIQKNKQSLVIANDFIGYETHVSKPLHEKAKIGSTLELSIYTKVREDEISLYGFAEAEELEFFRDLISVNGIGPKIALEILSSNIEQIKTAIIQENAAFLSKIPGIGKKTAERLIVELKNKVTPKDLASLPPDLDSQFEEVISALNSLGYQRGEIYKVLKTVPADIKTTEEIITYFLRHI